MAYTAKGTSFDTLFLKLSNANSALWLWGLNGSGQLGDNSLTSRSSPVQTVAGGSNWSQVSTGDSYSAAVKTDGTLWLWGSNSSGQLGDNSTTNRSSPVQTVAGGSNWSQVSTGDSYSAAVKTDGTLWLWGDNGSGQIGNNTNGNSFSSPVQTVAGGSNWSQVACGSTHTAAIKTDGTLWLWGDNGSGQIGNNTNGNSFSSPVQTVAGGSNWAQVSCGPSHTAAIKTDGTLWVWGLNNTGQLGDNSLTSKSSPVQTVAGGSNWSQVSCGRDNTAAIKTDSTLWLWGGNGSGQLGDNSTTTRSSPVQTVAGGSNWSQVATGNLNTGAIKTDGTLWMWGANNLGNLGTNNTTQVSSPVQTIAGGTNWSYVAVGRSSSGNRHTMALRGLVF